MLENWIESPKQLQKIMIRPSKQTIKDYWFKSEWFCVVFLLENFSNNKSLIEQYEPDNILVLTLNQYNL